MKPSPLHTVHLCSEESLSAVQRASRLQKRTFVPLLGRPTFRAAPERSPGRSEVAQFAGGGAAETPDSAVPNLSTWRFSAGSPGPQRNTACPFPAFIFSPFPSRICCYFCSLTGSQARSGACGWCTGTNAHVTGSPQRPPGCNRMSGPSMRYQKHRPARREHVQLPKARPRPPGG